MPWGHVLGYWYISSFDSTEITQCNAFFKETEWSHTRELRTPLECSGET